MVVGEGGRFRSRRRRSDSHRRGKEEGAEGNFLKTGARGSRWGTMIRRRVI